MDKNKLELADDILSAILGAAAYDEFATEDEELTAANKRFYAIADKVLTLVPQDIADELLESVAELCAAQSQSGVLYGIYVTGIMREAVAHPAELSRYIMERTGKARDDK